jgi:hypothetical protein
VTPHTRHADFDDILGSFTCKCLFKHVLCV